ncbi:RHS repeat-associated core domain-containing protein [Rubinisphaera margarita]|nr:RHS repeat-associated core domain-containing protein [Rubinisphaera margarita]
MTTYTYDANGNQTRVETPDSSITTTTWTYENQRSVVTQPDGAATTFTYSLVNRSGDEYCVQKQTPSETKLLIWDNNNVLQEYAPGGATQVQYVSQPRQYGLLLHDFSTGGTRYYHFDGFHSTSAITDESETIVSGFAYNGWGEVLNLPGGTTTPFLWIGELGYQYDPELVDYYIRRRAYDPRIARWLSMDPLGVAGGVNLYVYVENNPLAGVDPSGLQPPRRNPRGGGAFGPGGFGFGPGRPRPNGGQNGDIVGDAIPPTTLADENLINDPPYIGDAGELTCGVELKFTTAFWEPDRHALIVITAPDGSKIEVRGGPMHGSSSGPTSRQEIGNPYDCDEDRDGPWGPVIGYVGPHGFLGRDREGKEIYSNDGRPGQVYNSVVPIKARGGRSICELANCIMRVAKALGNSCQDYNIGTGKMRNSNTFISSILSTCGVGDPKPKDVVAPGWGEPWYRM